MAFGSILLDWLPGETLFSLVTRYHILSGNLRSEQTCLELFGHRRIGAQHDFPARLDQFVMSTVGRFGDAEEIIRSHSILPYYFPFADSSIRDKAIGAVRSGGIGGLKLALGATASRFGASNPLKACRDCLKEDLKKYHCQYWHREHQFPGVVVCPRHGSILYWSSAKLNGGQRFEWLMPLSSSLSRLADLSLPDEALSSPVCIRLACCAVGCGASMESFNPKLLRETYLSRLLEMGIASSGGRIRSKAAGDLLLPVCGPLRLFNCLRALPAEKHSAALLLSRLVTPRGFTSFPIKHFVAIISMFGEWDCFVRAYANAGGTPRQVMDLPQTAQVHPARAEVVASMQRGIPPSAAARAFGVAVQTAMEWAVSENCEITLRPSKLVPEVRLQAIALLRKGAAVEEISQRFGVSKSTSNRLLRTEPGLLMCWRSTRLEAKRNVFRKDWERIAKKLWPCTQTEMRASANRIFSWLYRNDRAWLVNFARRLLKRDAGCTTR